MTTFHCQATIFVGQVFNLRRISNPPVESIGMRSGTLENRPQATSPPLFLLAALLLCSGVHARRGIEPSPPGVSLPKSAWGESA